MDAGLVVVLHDPPVDLGGIGVLESACESLLGLLGVLKALS